MKVSVKKSIKKLDVQISDIVDKLGNEKLEPEDREELEARVDALAELRNKLCDGKDKYSLKPVMIKGAWGFAGLFAVLYYEKLEVITSKAFNMATRGIGD